MSGYGDTKRIHLKSGGRTACGQLINSRTMDVTDGTRHVTCMCCVRTRKYAIHMGGNVDLRPIPKNDCPCQRMGRGCNAYKVIEQPPYYICRHTKRAAFVPGKGEVGEYRIFGLMDD